MHTICREKVALIASFSQQQKGPPKTAGLFVHEAERRLSGRLTAAKETAGGGRLPDAPFNKTRKRFLRKGFCFPCCNYIVTLLKLNCNTLL
ncbi:MAG: hypothetical protein LKJ90_03550 [Faecalibacterium sp.]|jgi:hypothetical protein|nr:hypothetical protein [Faecalibacterium sp.]